MTWCCSRRRNRLREQHAKRLGELRFGRAARVQHAALIHTNLDVDRPREGERMARCLELFEEDLPLVLLALFLGFARHLEGAALDERDDRVQLAALEPDPVRFADIDDDARAPAKVLSVHELPTLRAWHAADAPARGRLHVGRRHADVDEGRPGTALLAIETELREDAPVEPDARAAGALVHGRRSDLHRTHVAAAPRL